MSPSELEKVEKAFNKYPISSTHLCVGGEMTTQHSAKATLAGPLAQWIIDRVEGALQLMDVSGVPRGNYVHIAHY